MKTLITSILIVIFFALVCSVTVFSNIYIPKTVVKYKLHQILKKRNDNLSIKKINYYWEGGHLFPSFSTFVIKLKDNNDHEIIELPISKLSELNAKLIQSCWERKNNRINKIKELNNNISSIAGITVFNFGRINYYKSNDVVYVFFDDKNNNSTSTPLHKGIKIALKNNKHLTLYYIPKSYQKEYTKKLHNYYNFIKTNERAYYLQLKNMDLASKAAHEVKHNNDAAHLQIYNTNKPLQKTIEDLKRTIHYLTDQHSKMTQQKPLIKDSLAYTEWKKEELTLNKKIRECQWKLRLKQNGPILPSEYLDIYAENALKKVFIEQLNEQYRIMICEKDLPLQLTISQDSGGLTCNWLDNRREQTNLEVFFSMHVGNRKITRWHYNKTNMGEAEIKH